MYSKYDIHFTDTNTDIYNLDVSFINWLHTRLAPNCRNKLNLIQLDWCPQIKELKDDFYELPFKSVSLSPVQFLSALRVVYGMTVS